jgi:hypothetical protein
MPRFSDIFSYEGCEGDYQRYVFLTCHLLKPVGSHERGKQIDSIKFDVTGLLLFFVIQDVVSGPYCLTTA